VPVRQIHSDTCSLTQELKKFSSGYSAGCQGFSRERAVERLTCSTASRRSPGAPPRPSFLYGLSSLGAGLPEASSAVTDRIGGGQPRLGFGGADRGLDLFLPEAGAVQRDRDHAARVEGT